MAFGTATLLVSGYFVWFLFTFSQYAFDDAYIHMRIARNLAYHGQPYYNLGEAVMGTSCHLWVALLATLFRLAGPQAGFVVILECLLVLGGLWIGTLILSERFSRLKSLALSALVIAVYLLNIGAGMMEMPLGIFLFLAATRAFQKDRSGLFGLASGLAMCVRYEFVIWTLLGACWAKDKRAFCRWASVPTSIIYGACLVFYKTVIPQPMIAKWAIFHWSTEATLRHFSFPSWKNTFGTPFFFVLSYQNVFDLRHLTAYACLLGVGCYVLWASQRRRIPAWAGLCMTFSIALAAFYLAKNAVLSPWYWPIILFPMGLAVASATEGRGTAIALLYVLATSGWWIDASRDAAALWTKRHELYSHESYNLRTTQYLRIGEDLQRKSPRESVCSAEIGGVGWTFRGKILDSLAFVSPEALRYYPSKLRGRWNWGKRAWELPLLPPLLVRDFRPDIVVVFPAYGSTFLEALGRPGFPPYRLMDRYVMFRDPRRTLWGHRFLEVYRLENKRPA